MNIFSGKIWGDTVKIKFQRQVCEGMVAEIGTLEAIKSKEEAFLRGQYTPFSRNDQLHHHPNLPVPKKAKKIRRMLLLKEVDVDEGEEKPAQAEVEEPTSMVEDVE